MKLLALSFCLLFLPFFVLAEDARKIAQHLQNISVTIKAEDGYSRSEGSGVLITRDINGEKVTFVWTAGHVVDNLRNVREVIDEGRPRKIVEFKDAQIVKELVESGRRVGEIKMDASVVKYSDADDGQDLALLMVRAKDYGKDTAKFYLKKGEDSIVPIGTRLYHVGSLLGQKGSNSMTTGIVSQVGRTLGKVEFDQTTVTAFPGSSGGGVFLQDGTYIGMLVRGAGENFNLIVPIRRIQAWAEENKLIWAIDPSVEAPSVSEIKGIVIEDSGLKKKSGGAGSDAKKDYPFLIRKTLTTSNTE